MKVKLECTLNRDGINKSESINAKIPPIKCKSNCSTKCESSVDKRIVDNKDRLRSEDILKIIIAKNRKLRELLKVN